MAKIDSRTSLDSRPTEVKKKSMSADKTAAVISTNVSKGTDPQTSIKKPKRPQSQSITLAHRESAKMEAKQNLEKRMEKARSKVISKSLLIKQRKLLTAARMNSLQLIRTTTFLYYEQDVNAADEHKNTSLYYTAKNGNLDFCQFLLDRGARVNTPCENGNTPMHMAFYSNNEAVILTSPFYSTKNYMMYRLLSFYLSTEGI